MERSTPSITVEQCAEGVQITVRFHGKYARVTLSEERAQRLAAEIAVMTCDGEYELTREGAAYVDA